MKGSSLDPNDVTGNILKYSEYEDVGTLPECTRRKYTIGKASLKLIQVMLDIEMKKVHF